MPHVYHASQSPEAVGAVQLYVVSAHLPTSYRMANAEVGVQVASMSQGTLGGHSVSAPNAGEVRYHTMDTWSNQWWPMCGFQQR